MEPYTLNGGESESDLEVILASVELKELLDSIRKEEMERMSLRF
jgi:hypothetical protein